MELDSQHIEALGRSRLKVALIEAGLEVATPERDNGVDLIAYRWDPDGGDFTALPIQMKAASGFIFGVHRKYQRIPQLVIAYVMNVRGADHAIYAMTYGEAEGIARALGWTATESWVKGYYVQTRQSKALVQALAPYLMTPGDWGRFFPKPGDGVAPAPKTTALV